MDGRPVVVGGEDFTQRGGSPSPSGLRRSVYAETLAIQLRRPLVRFLDGGGGGWERIRGRRVRSGGEAELAAGEGSFAAWAGGPWAARLAARFPGRSREVEVPGPTGPVTLRLLVD